MTPKGAIVLKLEEVVHAPFELKGVNNVYMGMTSPPMMNGHLGQMLLLH